MATLSPTGKIFIYNNTGSVDDGFLGADTVAGLGVGSGFGAGAARPACDIGGAHGRGVILTSPADQAVERFGVAVVAGE